MLKTDKKEQNYVKTHQIFLRDDNSQHSRGSCSGFFHRHSTCITDKHSLRNHVCGRNCHSKLSGRVCNSTSAYKFLSSKPKSFFLSFLSGFVEPIFCLLGYFLAVKITFLLPWVLSFAAGAMIFVVIDDLIPELCENKIKSLGTIMFCLGFLIMFLLDICL